MSATCRSFPKTTAAAAASLAGTRPSRLAGVRGGGARSLVSGEKIPVVTSDGWSRLELKSILDHEVIVVD